MVLRIVGSRAQDVEARRPVRNARSGRRLIGTLLVATMLTACTDPSDAPGATPPAGSEGDQSSSSDPTGLPQPVTLNVVAAGDTVAKRAYARIASGFQATRPDVTIRLRTYPRTAQVLTAVRQEAAEGRAPDLFWTDDADLASVVDDGLTQPVDGLLGDRGLEFGDDFQRSALNQFSSEGALQCMPVVMSPLVVYYNRQLLDRRNLTARDVTIPAAGTDTWTWEDFETVARDMAAVDGLGGVSGAYLGAGADLTTALVRSAGGDTVDDPVNPSSLTYSSEPAIQTLTALLSLAGDDTVSLTREQLSLRSPVDWFTSGRLGMILGTRADLPTLRASAELSFDVFPLPSFGRPRSVAETSGLCVSSVTPHVDQAADFLAYVVGPEAGRELAGTQRLVPIRLDTAAEPAFTEPGSRPRMSEVFSASQRRSDPTGYAVAWPVVEDRAARVLARVTSEVMSGSPVDLLAQLSALDTTSQRLLAVDPE